MKNKNKMQYKRKQLLSEGMSLDQIKQGLNYDLLRMLKNFKNTVFNVEGHINHPEIKKFMRSQQVKVLEPNRQFKKTPEDGDNLEYSLDAYIDFLLVNVIENGQPIISEIDINNPTNGIKGKFTEFILRVLSSSFFKNSIENWPMITDFLRICKNSGSNLYKSKNNFFDNSIIPLMNDRVANGEKLGSINPETGLRGSNFSRPSQVSPLQDKVMKVFEAYGTYNGKNLLQTILEEVIDNNSESEVVSFAGYDVRLIDYCLKNGYWKEFNVAGQPSSTRLFFIGNGDIESLNLNPEYMSDDDIYDQWLSLDYGEQEQWGDFGNYLDAIIVDQDRIESDLEVKKSFNYYFTLRALTYACNVYPFKTAYNVALSNTIVTSREIAYVKSLSSDDYVVINNNQKYQIRKTTDWCTKDEEWINKYIMPSSGEKVEGFILCLNDALAFDDPNGALQTGIREEYDMFGNKSNRFNNRLLTKNANDNHASCPAFLNDHFNDKSTRVIANLIDDDKRQYEKFRNISFPKDKKLSKEEKKIYFEKMMQGKKMTNENLLRRYIRQLLK